jgi:hypothetical protein
MKVTFSCRKDFLNVVDRGSMVDIEADFVDRNSLEVEIDGEIIYFKNVKKEDFYAYDEKNGSLNLEESKV